MSYFPYAFPFTFADQYIPFISMIKANSGTDMATTYSSQIKLLRTSDGVLHAVYYRLDGEGYSHIYHAYSSDGGFTWTEEAITSGSGGGDPGARPAIAVDLNNHLHVVWHGYSSSSPTVIQIRYRKYDGSWGSAINLTSGSYHQWQPSIAVDGNNHLHIVWHGTHAGSPSYRQIRYIKYDGSWSTITDLTSGMYNQASASIAVDGNNYLYVAWDGYHSGSPAYKQIRLRRFTDSWQSIENLTSESSHQSNACVAVDGSNYVHVVWGGIHAGSTSYRQIRYRKYTDSWQEIENLTSEDYDQYDASITANSNNNLHVIWNGSHSDSPIYGQVRYRKYTNSWGNIKNLTLIQAEQSCPVALWAFHPAGLNVPISGFAFIWTDGEDVKYYASWDFTLAVLLSRTDGVRLSDVGLAELWGYLYLYLTQGITLSDTRTREMLASLTHTEGVRTGDIRIREMLTSLLRTEGVHFSDTRIREMIASLLRTDGIRIDDESIVTLVEAIQLAITQGIRVSDSPTLAMLATLAILEALKLGDYSILDKLGKLVQLWLSIKPYHSIEMTTKPYHDVIIYTEPYHDVIIYTEEDGIMRRNWQRPETVPIWAEVKYEGVLYDPDQGVKLTLISPITKTVLLNDAPMTKVSTGKYVYYWNSAADSELGWYLAAGRTQDGAGEGARVTIEHDGFNLQS